MQHKVALIVYYAPQDKAKDDEDEDTMEEFIGAFKHPGILYDRVLISWVLVKATQTVFSAMNQEKSCHGENFTKVDTHED